MYLVNYIIGSYYIVRSLFRLSENSSKYLFNNNIITLPVSKFDKINETIYINAAIYDQNKNKLNEPIFFDLPCSSVINYQKIDNFL